MGFGLCAFGYAFIMLDVVGLDLVGYLLLAAGFRRVSSELKFNKGFCFAFYSAAALCLAGALNLFEFVNDQTEFIKLPEVILTVGTVYYVLLSIIMSASYIGEVKRIASNGGARFFSFFAGINLYLSLFYFAALLSASFFPPEGSFGTALIVGKYVVIFLNAALLLLCFINITTSARIETEKEIIAQETEILERKRILKQEKKKRGKEDEDDE